MAQPDATPLELAARLQSLADYERLYGNRQRSAEYQQKAADLYAKAGAFLPMAARFRNLTELALLSHDVDRIVQLNDLTNRYLALGDAAARRLILPSETLEAPRGGAAQRQSAGDLVRRRTPSHGGSASRSLCAGGARNPVRTGHHALSFDYSSVARVIVNLTDPAICTRPDESAASSDAMNALMKSTRAFGFPAGPFFGEHIRIDLDCSIRVRLARKCRTGICGHAAFQGDICRDGGSPETHCAPRLQQGTHRQPSRHWMEPFSGLPSPYCLPANNSISSACRPIPVRKPSRITWRRTPKPVRTRTR